MYRKHLRMARGEGEAQESGIRSHFVERMVKLPMVHVAWDYATSTYSHLKESNKLVNFTLTNAEKSVNFVAEQAKPVVRKFEKQIQVVDNLACKGLGTLEQKVPLITKPPQQILGETRKLYSDTVSTRIEGIRNYSNGKVKSVADYGLQKAVDIFGSHLVQSVITSVDGAFVVTEHYLDVILPPVAGECHNQENEVEDEKNKSVLSRVGHLSSKLRHRTYKHLTQKIENLQEKALDVLIYPVIIVQNAKENLEAAQNYAKALWERVKQDEIDPSQTGITLRVIRLGVRPFVKITDLLGIILQKKSQTTDTDTPTTPEDPALSPVIVTAVKDGALWVVGMLRLAPSMIMLYTYIFFSWLDSKNSPKVEVDGVLYEEDDKNHEMNHFGQNNSK